MTETFSPEQMLQLKEIVRSAVREEMADVGLRIDNQDHQDDLREDMRFVRRLRQMWDSAAGKLGGAILSAGIIILLAIFGLGFWDWLRGGIK